MERKDPPHEVILLNFGGPTRAEEVEPFLYRLFLDPFIIRTKMPDFFRRFLARRIAKKRAPKVIAEYQKIGFSPINRLTEAQGRHLEAELRKIRPDSKVRIVNRYMAPFADDVVKDVDPARAKVFLLSLYPHFCHSTTVSSIRDFDLAFERRHGHREFPSVRIFSWWQNPKYVEHTTKKLREALEKVLTLDAMSPVTILFSAHGIPERYDTRGDPYVTETRAHFSELRRRTEGWLDTLAGGKQKGRCHWELSFQSRVGPVAWVRPYTDEKIQELGKSRGGALLLVPVSFTSDHIETLFEMDHTYRELALTVGFKSYARATPSNDDPELAACLADVLRQHGY